MIATLKFNMEKPEDRQAHMRAVKADKAYGALHDISELLRQYRKYGGFEKHFDKPLTEEQRDMLANFVDMLEDEIRIAIRENNIDIHEEYT
jgi:RNA polymerase-interacting CarD/CdnL/TRCF family regulator